MLRSRRGVGVGVGGGEDPLGKAPGGCPAGSQLSWGEKSDPVGGPWAQGAGGQWRWPASLCALAWYWPTVDPPGPH